MIEADILNTPLSVSDDTMISHSLQGNRFYYILLYFQYFYAIIYANVCFYLRNRRSVFRKRAPAAANALQPSEFRAESRKIRPERENAVTRLGYGVFITWGPQVKAGDPFAQIFSVLFTK